MLDINISKAPQAFKAKCLVEGVLFSEVDERSYFQEMGKSFIWPAGIRKFIWTEEYIGTCYVVVLILESNDQM